MSGRKDGRTLFLRQTSPDDTQVCLLYRELQGDLAGSNIQADGRRVIVLEVVQVGRACTRDLVADALAGWAVKGRNLVGIAWRDSDSPEILSNIGCVIISGLRRRR